MKYHLEGTQTEYQPGSNDGVLANKLGLTTTDEIENAELILLNQLYQKVLNEELPQGALSTAVLKGWHRRWLSPIYAWAGEERSVNMAKGDFQFAAAAQIPKLLQTLDEQYLARYTPCHDMADDQLIEAIAVTHVEFILVHPFREGNGRLARLLADVMAVQAGYGPLDYSSWDRHKDDYILAIQQGLGCEYGPMMTWVERAFNAV